MVIRRTVMAAVLSSLRFSVFYRLTNVTLCSLLRCFYILEVSAGCQLHLYWINVCFHGLSR